MSKDVKYLLYVPVAFFTRRAGFLQMVMASAICASASSVPLNCPGEDEGDTCHLGTHLTVSA